MRKLSLLILIITFISCKNESKNNQSNKDKSNTEISSSYSSKLNKENNNSLKIIEPTLKRGTTYILKKYLTMVPFLQFLFLKKVMIMN